MNKYARIDKKCSKWQVYYILYNERFLSPAGIAKRFGVSIKTVVRAIKYYQYPKNAIFPNHESWRRAKQLSWMYF